MKKKTTKNPIVINHLLFLFTNIKIMATEYIPYHWLNISKCLRDHQGFLTDIGLGAFSHLGEMLRVALVAIIEPGRNRIAINESEGPFLAMGFMERKNLIDVISAINLAEYSGSTI